MSTYIIEKFLACSFFKLFRGIFGAASSFYYSEMAGISKNLSNTSNTSENSSNFVANEPPVRTPVSKGRRGRPSKKRENERTILSWLIDCKKVQENALVCYLDNNAKIPLKEGKITRAGILCLCCIQVLTAEHFQAHAGWEIGKPFENIFIMETRSSLLSCMNEAWNQPRELARHKFNTIEGEGGSSDIYDDACMICADGGELMCCDKCNSTYHHRCMDMEVSLFICLFFKQLLNLVQFD